MNHLRDYCERVNEAESPPRRGDAQQRPERCLEQAVRRDAVVVGGQLVADGYTWIETAELLELSARTLRHWRQELLLDPQRPAPLLGRPVQRSPRERRNEVIHLLDEVGPAIGVPTLQTGFPDLPRAEIDDLLRRYRRLWRRRNYEPLRVLHWHGPGRIWAIDFTGPLALPVEGRYPHLLAVRDLASGQQLLWLPVAAATAFEAASALAGLFLTHGAPLVLKSDNGSALTAGAVEQVIFDFGVKMLFSPPAWPRYNGAIETDMGLRETRTEQHACRHGRPGQWTLDDVAAARLEANATARPRGPTGPSPDELWAARSSINAMERALFAAEVERQRQASDAQGGPDANPQTDLSDSARERRSIRRALEGLGYLTYTRRRLPLPIKPKKVAIIT